jgi:hypothetical protein
MILAVPHRLISLHEHERRNLDDYHFAAGVVRLGMDDADDAARRYLRHF